MSLDPWVMCIDPIFNIWNFHFADFFFFFFHILKVVNHLNLFLLFIFIALFSSHIFRLICSVLFIVLTCTLYRTDIYSSHHFAIRSTNRSFIQSPLKHLSQKPSIFASQFSFEYFCLFIFLYVLKGSQRKYQIQKHSH